MHDHGERGRLCTLLRAHRAAAGLTQRQLAGRAGISLGVLEDLEQGRTLRPHRDALARLARALRLSAAELDELTSMSAAGRARSPGQRDPAEPAARGLRLEVLGPLAMWRDGRALALGPARLRAVLGLLALHADTGLHRAAIVDALWGEDPPVSSVAMIQAQISRIRRLLGPGPSPGGGPWLPWDGYGYRLCTDGIQLDLAEFDELAERARRARATQDMASACELYEQALGRWRGRVLEGVEALRDHPAVTGQGRRYADLVIEYADVAAGAGRHDHVVTHLTALAAQEPLDERAHARLMVSLAATGRQAAALHVYEELAGRLDAELGVRPGPELSEVHLRILRQQVPSAAARREAALAMPVTTVVGAPGPQIPRQLPAAPPRFVGRAAELTALTNVLDQREETVVISVISGTAGVGKTALALHWAHQVAERFPDGQLHVNLQGYGPAGAPMAPSAALRLLLDSLGVAPGQIPAGLDAQAALYRSRLAGRRVLIMLDNARDPEQVRPLLPGAAGCAVLITSRNQLTGLVAGDGARPLILATLTEGEARELLGSRLGWRRTAAEPTAVADMAGLCAGLPLALTIVAARAMARPDQPLATLAAELRGAAAPPDNRAASALLDELSTGDTATDVRTVFSWSCRQLSEPATGMFRLLGLHPGPDISGPAAASLAGVPFGQIRQALAELSRAHLVAEQQGRFSLHDLLRAYATEQARGLPEAQQRAAVHRMLDHYLHTTAAAAMQLDQLDTSPRLSAPVPGVTPEAPADRGQAYAWFEAERQVLSAVIIQAHQRGFDAHAWQLPVELHEFYYRRAYLSDAIAVYRIALAAANRAGNRVWQAMAHRALGSAHLWLDLDAEAQEQFRRALDLYRSLGNRQGEGRTHFFLALLHSGRGDHSTALIHCRRARRLLHAHGQAGDEAHTVNTTGLFHARLGNYELAQTCCEQALRMHRQAGTRLGEALTLQILGLLRSRAGHHQEAAALLAGAIEVCRETGDRLFLADMLDDLGEVYRTSGELSAAHHSWRQALATLDRLAHPRARQVRAKLATRDQVMRWWTPDTDCPDRTAGPAVRRSPESGESARPHHE